MTQKAMIYGVPFFIAMLVKNAKMVPVMIGAIVMSGKVLAQGGGLTHPAALRRSWPWPRPLLSCDLDSAKRAQTHEGGSFVIPQSIPLPAIL